MTVSRFQRLFLLSSALVLIYLPIQLYIIYRNATVLPLIPYSWSLIHGKDWMNIVMVPMHGVVPLDRWITIVLGIFIFLFFGLGSDATKMYHKWWLKLDLGTNFPGIRGQASATQPQAFRVEHEHGSFASLLFDFCRKRLSWRRSSLALLEKDDAATVTTGSITSPIEAEKLSRAQEAAFMTAPINASQPTIAPSEPEDRPPPAVLARSRASFFSYLTQSRGPSAPDDIESALDQHENHRPNRCIAGLWHANNMNGSPVGVPAMRMGNCNGLRF
ncbi:MAG: hypothetical protein Q9201_005318 [Fulgogasparrea decipioides]